jgi:hypothetical protein
MMVEIVQNNLRSPLKQASWLVPSIPGNRDIAIVRIIAGGQAGPRS